MCFDSSPDAYGRLLQNASCGAEFILLVHAKDKDRVQLSDIPEGYLDSTCLGRSSKQPRSLNLISC